MTSARKKALRLAEGRLRQAKALADIDPKSFEGPVPVGAVLADASQLVHNNTYGLLPRFYVDRVVVCRDCGKEEVWPAERQKWWYEVAKANVHAKAVYCRSCRRERRAAKAAV